VIGAVVCVKTKVSDEEPVVFDTGYLHSWGSRVTGLNIRPDYTNTLGSRVHFPRALLASTYADTELFQFVSTLSLSLPPSLSLYGSFFSVVAVFQSVMLNETQLLRPIRPSPRLKC